MNGYQMGALQRRPTPPHLPCKPQVKPSVYLGPRGVHRTLVNRDGLHLQVGCRLRPVCPLGDEAHGCSA